MIKTLPVLFLIWACFSSLIACGQDVAPANPRLARVIDSLYVLDQQPFQQALIKKMPPDSVQAQSHRVYWKNHIVLQQILQSYHYPGYTLVGPQATQHFNTLVLHCFFDVPFQKQVLELFRQEGQRQPALQQDKRYLRDLAYLTDKVKTNSGQPQVYGTQISYSPEKGAFLLPTEDLAGLKQRRQAMQLEPIEQYLERGTKMHQQMNAQKAN